MKEIKNSFTLPSCKGSSNDFCASSVYSSETTPLSNSKGSTSFIMRTPVQSGCPWKPMILFRNNTISCSQVFDFASDFAPLGNSKTHSPCASARLKGSLKPIAAIAVPGTIVSFLNTYSFDGLGPTRPPSALANSWCEKQIPTNLGVSASLSATAWTNASSSRIQVVSCRTEA